MCYCCFGLLLDDADCCDCLYHAILSSSLSLIFVLILLYSSVLPCRSLYTYMYCTVHGQTSWSWVPFNLLLLQYKNCFLFFIFSHPCFFYIISSVRLSTGSSPDAHNGTSNLYLFEPQLIVCGGSPVQSSRPLQNSPLLPFTQLSD